jgi:hypothetical protein
MKKFSFTVLLISTLLVSCTQDEVFYSCDEQTDSWIKANIETIQTMSRSDWKEANTTVSIPIYRAFTPTQKLNFWVEKYAELKTLKWSKEELEYIQKAYSYIFDNKIVFDTEERTDTDLDNVNKFFYLWYKEVRAKLGWDNKIIYAVVCTGAEVIDTTGNIITPNNTTTALSSISAASESTCDCNLSSIATCLATGLSCEKSDCDSTVHGCGWFLVNSCDGICGGDLIQ